MRAQGRFAMTLPLPLAGAGRRRARQVSAAALAMLVLVAPAVRAQAPAQVAGDDPYTATVTVDATSDTVAKARTQARIDGQRRALTAVAERFAGGADKTKPLKLSDNAVTDLVASFEVANERMTAVRYVADYTFHFRKPEIDKALQSAGIAVAAAKPAGDAGGSGGAAAGPGPGAGVKPIVLLPIYEANGPPLLWDDPNPWRAAWANPPSAAGGRLMVPLGDVGDVDAIDVDKARSGDAAALSAIAAKYGADEALVVVATPRTAAGKEDGLDVTVRRYRQGQFVDVHADVINARPGAAETDLFRAAADKIAADVATGWKDAKPPGGDERGSFVAVLPITGLDDWIKVRDRLGTLATVRKVELKSLSRQEATLEIQYVGDLDHLKSSLAGINLDLVRGDPVWQLSRSAAARP
jgi:hypothetical protein